MVLVGYWPLNESSSSTAYDHSGNENHGTINDGGDSTVPGAKGILGQNAYSFDGSNDYVETPVSNLGQSWTLSVWARVDVAAGEFRSFLTNGRFGGVDGGMHLGKEETGELRLWSPDTGRLYGPQTSTKVWYHLVGLYDGSTVKFYVNSREEDTYSLGTYSENPNGMWIGASDYYGEHTNGKISEGRVYNHALTPAEIQYLYQVGKRGRQVSSEKTS